MVVPKVVSGNDHSFTKTGARERVLASLNLASGVNNHLQQFPKHDTMKLNENNFLLWKQ